MRLSKTRQRIRYCSHWTNAVATGDLAESSTDIAKTVSFNVTNWLAREKRQLVKTTRSLSYKCGLRTRNRDDLKTSRGRMQSESRRTEHYTKENRAEVFVYSHVHFKSFFFCRDLTSNNICRLPVDTFAGLKSLRYLYVWLDTFDIF